MSPSSTTTLLNLYNQGWQGFARLWQCSAVPQPQGCTTVGTGILPIPEIRVSHPSMTASLCSRQARGIAGSCAGKDWLLSSTGRDIALPRCLPIQKRPWPLHCLGITMMLTGQGSTHLTRILSWVPAGPLHLPDLCFPSCQAGRWESLKLLGL